MAVEWNEVRARVLEDAAAGLFDAYDLATVSAAPVDCSACSLAGVMGFAGESLRGSVTLCASRAVVRATSPALNDDHALRDWVAELTNQLVGRIKNRMRRYGVTFDLSTPTVVSGDNISHHLHLHTSHVHHYRTSAGPVVISLAVEVGPGFVLEELEPFNEADFVTEGDCLFF